MNAEKLTHAVARTAGVLAASLAGFALVVRPMFPGLASPLHRNILVHLVIAMAALLAVLAVALRRRIELRSPAFMLALAAFLLTTVVAACLAEDRYAATVRALDLAAWGVLVLVLLDALATPFRARVVLAALLATLAVVVADAFYQYFVALPGIRGDLDAHVRRMTESGALDPSMVQAFMKRAASGDVFGTFVTANGFAGYLILLLPVAAAAAWVRWRERTTRLGPGAALMGLVALGGVVTLALTRSKGGILALAVALGGWAAFAVLGRLRRATAATVVLLAAAVGLLAPAAPETDNVPVGDAAAPRRFVLGDSAEVRIEYWKAGWEVLRRHPWVGVGPGNFADHYLAFRTPEGSETRHAHNDYLEVAVEQGFPGLAAFLAVWVAWWAGLCRGRRVFASEAGEDAKVRRVFVGVVGVVGAAAVVFVMNRFTPTDETRAMLAAGIVLWLLVYFVQVHAGLRASPEWTAKHARLLRGAVAAGVGALLVHLAIDFDMSEPGITATLAGALVVGLALRDARGSAKERPFGAPGQAALVAGVAAPLVLTLAVFLYPLVDMSVALEQAREAREESARKFREAAQWRLQGDTRGAWALLKDAEDTIRVEVPKRLDEAIRAYPGNPEPWMERARMEATALRATPRGELKRLEEYLGRAKTLSPRDPAPYALMTEVLQDRMKSAQASGDSAQAAALASSALGEADGAVARYPAQPKLHLTRARLLDRLDRGPEAVDEYRRALDLAERTSEKEIKFTVDELREIRLAIRRLESTPPRR